MKDMHHGLKKHFAWAWNTVPVRCHGVPLLSRFLFAVQVANSTSSWSSWSLPLSARLCELVSKVSLGRLGHRPRKTGAVWWQPTGCHVFFLISLWTARGGPHTGNYLWVGLVIQCCSSPNTVSQEDTGQSAMTCKLNPNPRPPRTGRTWENQLFNNDIFLLSTIPQPNNCRMQWQEKHGELMRNVGRNNCGTKTY